MIQGGSCRPGRLERLQVLQHGRDQLGHRRVDVYRARDDGVGRLGVHRVEQAVYGLVTGQAEDRRAQDLFAVARRPDAWAWRSVMPTRPSGGSMYSP